MVSLQPDPAHPNIIHVTFTGVWQVDDLLEAIDLIFAEVEREGLDPWHGALLDFSATRGHPSDIVLRFPEVIAHVRAQCTTQTAPFPIVIVPARPASLRQARILLGLFERLYGMHIHAAEQTVAARALLQQWPRTPASGS